MTVQTIRAGFLGSVERFPDRQALTVGKEERTYAQLFAEAARIAATLDKHAGADEGLLTAVFGHRHPTAFAGVLGALLRGHGYVPLNPTFPPDRSRAMIERSRCRCLVVGPTARGQLDALLEGLEGRLVVLLPDSEDVTELAARWPTHHFLAAADLEPKEAFELRPASPDAIGYLLFTSGSTGRPKGVMVAHRNVVAFVDAMVERYGITEQDRFSNTFDLTFDLSAFDMFVPWARGACLCVPTASQKLFPGKYVKKQALTVWFSVPSTGVLMKRLRMLKPGAYPTLRWALFCGEALPVEVIEAFAEAAPNAVAENLYGPTELTIACTLYRWDPVRSPAESHLGVVPIGEPYPNMVIRVSDSQYNEVPRGEPGELLMTGPQMTLGYWEDEERTEKAFVVPPGETRTFYRTGDRVRYPEGGPLIYLGRVDNQIKIMGYRVELGEIEAVLRDVSGADVAIAIGWPKTSSGANGVVGFVGAPGADAAAIQEAARDRLPSYMQPSAIHLVETFPLNANGKVDRNALLSRLQEMERSA